MGHERHLVHFAAGVLPYISRFAEARDDAIQTAAGPARAYCVSGIEKGKNRW